MEDRNAWALSLSPQCGAAQLHVRHMKFLLLVSILYSVALSQYEMVFQTSSKPRRISEAELDNSYAFKMLLVELNTKRYQAPLTYKKVLNGKIIDSIKLDSKSDTSVIDTGKHYGFDVCLCDAPIDSLIVKQTNTKYVFYCNQTKIIEKGKIVKEVTNSNRNIDYAVEVLRDEYCNKGYGCSEKSDVNKFHYEYDVYKENQWYQSQIILRSDEFNEIRNILDNIELSTTNREVEITLNYDWSTNQITISVEKSRNVPDLLVKKVNERFMSIINGTNVVLLRDVEKIRYKKIYWGK
jgi:hypothetical protein